MAVADAAGDEVGIELVGVDPLVGGAPADPQRERIAVDVAIPVQVDAIGAHPEKRHRAAVDAKDRLVAPARGNVESLVAPFRDEPVGDERLDDLVDGGADLVGVALYEQRHALALDREHAGKPRQHLGVVAPHPADPRLARDERHRPRRVVVVATGDVVGKRHKGSIARGQYRVNADDLPHAPGDVIDRVALDPGEADLDR